MKKLFIMRQQVHSPLTTKHWWIIPIRVIENTSQRIVPGRERGQQSEKASGFDDWWVRQAGLIGVQISDTKEHESHVQSEEQKEERDGGAQGCEEKKRGEDEPALETA